MNTLRRETARLALGLLLSLLAGSDAWCEPSLRASSNRDIVATMQPFPAKASAAVDSLLSFASGTCSSFSPDSTRSLVAFVSNACAIDSGWEMPERKGAAGAAYVVKVNVPLEQYLSLNFHPKIPDFAVFPTSLRYSECLNSNEMIRSYACVGKSPPGDQAYVTGRMTGMEEITPNPESGSYFSYTNSRTLLRCRVEGHDVIFSCAETLSPSTFSCRGIPVGPLEQALFYYSGKPGLNLSGMTWMLSRITHSTTLSVFVAMSSNETAVATFAWLNAGWKGVNVTRACHILNSQVSTLDFSRRIAEHPAVSVPAIVAIAESVAAMTPAEIHTDYEKYLAYVRLWRDRDKKGAFCRNSFLQDLYDPKASQAIPLTHQRALIIQERVRILLGMPTWSTTTGPTSLARH